MSESQDNADYWMPKYADELLSDEYALDWRDFLNRKNESDFKDLLTMPLNTQRFSHYCKNTVNALHAICEELTLPPEALYLAVDIFDRYWVKYLGENNLVTEEIWEYLNTNANYYAWLRAFSCLQLAVKQVCISKIIAINNIVKIMYKLGFTVDRKTIVQSEIEVYKTLKMNIPYTSVLTFVEMFFENMETLLAKVNKAELLEVAVKVTNVVYKYHKEIYSKLHVSFKKDYVQTLPEKVGFLVVEADNIRLSASVVYATCCLYDPSRKVGESILKHLAYTTEYTNSEIMTFGNIILHVILRHSA